MMTEVFYIEDKIKDREAFYKKIATAPSLKNGIDFYESNQSIAEEIIENIANYLDPVGDDPVALKNKAKIYLDNKFKNTNGFILDFQLLGISNNDNVSGTKFYENYIYLNENLKNSNILFLTHFKSNTSKALLEIRKKILTDRRYDQTRIKVMSKYNFAPTHCPDIITEIESLFFNPSF